MTDPIPPVGGPTGPRRVSRRDAEEVSSDSAQDESANTLPVPVEPPAAEAAAPRSRRAAFAAFAAQILGGGQKRGLRGGPETLEKARSTYLETEWSGPADRRLRSGRITKTEV